MSGLFWNLGDEVFIWTLNVLLQVSVIAAIALAIGRSLRRSAAARYWLLCSALMLVLLCPLLAAVVQSTRMSLVSVSIVKDDVAERGVPVAVDDAKATPGGELDTSITSFEPNTSWQSEFAANIEQPPQVASSERAQLPRVDNLGTVSVELSTTNVAGDTAASKTVVAESESTSWGMALRTFGSWLLLAWVAVSVVLTTRLIVAWCRLAKILREAIPNTDERLSESFQQVWPALAGRSKRRIPQLVFSDRISGPMASGIRSPKVVLPKSFAGKIRPEQLRDILVHEVAHIARGDQIVVLLQNVAAAWFWLHPLVRMLNRSLAQAREEVCDNYVLAATDASSYSRTLLTLAQILESPRTVPGAVGLFASRWKLEERVAGLLDERRNRVTSISKAALSLIAGLAIALGVTAAVATISVAANETDDNTGGGRSGVNDADSADGAGSEDSEDTVMVRGIVLKPDGSPAARAAVRAAASMNVDLKRMLGPDFETPLETAVTDEKGRFEVAVHKKPFGDDLSGMQHAAEWLETHVAASLVGFGGDWVVLKSLDELDDLTLRLVDDQPIRGRVIDLEGNPIPDFSIAVDSLRASGSGDLSEWLEAVRNGETPHTSYAHAAKHAALRVVGIETELKTDADGRFELRNVGRERIVELQAVSETAALERFRVVSRDIAPLTMAVFADETMQVYGSDFVLSASPSRPVTGVVVDAQTKQPLPGVQVEAYRFAGSMMSGRDEISTTTDAKGRFRLIGFPKAQPKAKRGRRHNYVFFRPRDNQPYLMRRLQVPVAEGLGEIEMTAELHRGTWISGRVTDKVTGEGVRGVRMYYLAYRSNEFAQRLPEFDEDGNVDSDQTRFVTDADGDYRLVGLPGPAVIGAESIAKPYRYGVGFDDLEIPEKQSTFRLFYRNPLSPSPKWPNSVVKIDPPADVESVEVNLELDPGASIELRVVDENDELVEGASLRGLSARFGRPATTEARPYIVENLAANEDRVVIAHHVGRHIGRVARVKRDQVEKGRMRLRLQRCIKVTGKLIDQGEPLPGIRIEPRILPVGNFSSNLPEFTTDSDGRFKGTLLPGARYNLFAQGNGLDFYAVVTDGLTVKPGEDIDLGTLNLTEDRKFSRVERNEDATVESGKTYDMDRIELQLDKE